MKYARHDAQKLLYEPHSVGYARSGNMQRNSSRKGVRKEYVGIFISKVAPIQSQIRIKLA